MPFLYIDVPRLRFHNEREVSLWLVTVTPYSRIAFYAFSWLTEKLNVQFSRL